MKSPSRFLHVLISVLPVACGIQIAHAQNSTASVPQGFVSVDIKGSPGGGAYNVTQFSAPLEATAAMAGQNAARISAITTNTLSNSSAGWTANALAAATSPCFVFIRSGSASGAMFRITGNTTTSLSLDTQGLDLTTLDIATGSSGDRYEIVSGQTLLSLIGTPVEGVIGGTSAQLAANQVDKILLNDENGLTRFYYYDTSVSQWRREGSLANQDHLPIPPCAGLAYYRISSISLNMTFLGKVPSTAARFAVPRSGTTIFASFFPASTTLVTLGLHSLAGWRKLGDAGVTLETTDRVVTLDGQGILRSYYYTGAQWKRPGSAVNQGSAIIPASSAIYCIRYGSGANETWLRPLPYNLN